MDSLLGGTLAKLPERFESCSNRPGWCGQAIRVCSHAGWKKVRLLSAGPSTFKYDFGSEDKEGNQDSRYEWAACHPQTMDFVSLTERLRFEISEHTYSTGIT